MMTMHAAKGLEFPVVVIAGLEEGLFPHSRAFEDEGELEEERRLCYVGMTRARQRLVLTGAARRRTFGEYKATNPSRFLEEVPAELIEQAADYSSEYQRSFGRAGRPTTDAGQNAYRRGGVVPLAGARGDHGRSRRTRTRISPRPAASSLERACATRSSASAP